jgi:hypothetical protein
MKKQTAVEYLIDAIRNRIADGTLNAITLSELKIEAKVMERDQIIEAYKAACEEMLNQKDSTLIFEWVNAIKYYDEIYR